MRTALAGLLLGLVPSISLASETGPLPGFFQESWDIVAAQPLTIYQRPRAVAARASLADLPSIITTGVPTPPERPLVVPGPVAYASVTPIAPVQLPGVDAAATASLPEIPLPIKRPANIQDALSEVDVREAEPAIPETKVAMLGALPGAGMAINALARMEPMAPIAKGSCSVGTPYKVSALGPAGRAALSPSATLDYDMIQALVRWENNVQAIAKATLGQPIVEFHVAASYDCRTMDHRRRARMSEHARANALDVSSFRTAGGDTVTVRSDYYGGGAKSAFLKQVRASTCDTFQVVLGPGSRDGMHEDHIHMDLGRWKACR